MNKKVLGVVFLFLAILIAGAYATDTSHAANDSFITIRQHGAFMLELKFLFYHGDDLLETWDNTHIYAPTESKVPIPEGTTKITLIAKIRSSGFSEKTFYAQCPLRDNLLWCWGPLTDGHILFNGYEHSIQ
jgi:hypothetical protein